MVQWASTFSLIYDSPKYLEKWVQLEVISINILFFWYLTSFCVFQDIPTFCISLCVISHSLFINCTACRGQFCALFSQAGWAFVTSLAKRIQQSVVARILRPSQKMKYGFYWLFFSWNTWTWNGWTTCILFWLRVS